MRAGSLDTLELEVRRIPGVISVSYDEENRVLTILAPLPAVADELKRQATMLARAHVTEELTIEVDSNASPEPEVIEEEPVVVEDATTDPQTSNAPITGSGFGARDQRVQLTSVAVEDDIATIDLRFGQQQTQATGSVLNPLSVAEAVLVGLDQLSMPVPFDIRSATPIGGATRQVMVVLLRGTTNAEERYGAAAGETPAEATARATLDALNRYLAENYPQPK